MARRKKSEKEIEDYRHSGETRKNNPPAKIAAEGVVPLLPKARYAYSPRRSPELRFDTDGLPDRVQELLNEAAGRPLAREELELLRDALSDQEPWLEWAEKQEQRRRGFFEVDPVALHIHERVSAQAILRVAARQDAQRSLFADPEQEYHEAVQFYQHDIDWTNRLILGDSLQVMSSLARREDLAGKVQMIYIDPPYGIKFASNFQPRIGSRDVRDREQDLSREAETVKAYRDTWHLGVHSYLTYLRDRLLTARELLSDSGSVFVQIGDENVHLVRALLDEVFGKANYVALINVTKTSGQTARYLSVNTDYLIWYCRDFDAVKYRTVLAQKELGGAGSSMYQYLMMPSGEMRRLNPDERAGSADLPEGSCAVRLGDATSQRQGRPSGPGSAMHFPVSLYSTEYLPPGTRGWSTTAEGMARLAKAERLLPQGGRLSYIRRLDDYVAFDVGNNWTDVAGATSRMFVVQTNATVIERCMLMTTDPGDLVLDPTCGSGTTAFVAEQWGRRWITIDTSRVAVAIARQRLLTANYNYYELRDAGSGPAGGLRYKAVPHITLRSIAQNTNLDPIFEKYEPILSGRLQACNKALAEVSDDLRRKLREKLLTKQKSEGKRSVTEADERRWSLPSAGETWEHWEVPFDTDVDWPKKLQEAVTAYRQAWRAKMDEVNACIAENADQEELVDQPEVRKGVVRVSGPFTVEAVQPPEMSLGEPTLTAVDVEGAFDGEPEPLEEAFEVRMVEMRADHEAQNLDAYLEQMTRLLRQDGVTFPNNRHSGFSRLERIESSEPGIHAHGRWAPDGEEDPDPEGRANVAVSFGPQYGPVTARMVEEVVRSANRLGYDELVMAGFSFDGPAQAAIEEVQRPHLRVHHAHIRPDVNPGMNGLLKEQPGSQLFTVFGQPRARVDGPDKSGEFTVTMEGVDVYDPVENVVRSTGADKVAAWFLDGDYDGRTFCITQAFFPDRSAWSKLARALKDVVDEDAFEAFSGTTSLPFPARKHHCVAVKVIDPRGNEVMRVHSLPRDRGDS